MLGNAAGFTGGYFRGADRIQQTRFAVINVPENGHNRRTQFQLRAVFPGDHLTPERDFTSFFFDFLFNDFSNGFKAIFANDNCSRVKIHRLVNGRHHAVRH